MLISDFIWYYLNIKIRVKRRRNDDKLRIIIWRFQQRSKLHDKWYVVEERNDPRPALGFGHISKWIQIRQFQNYGLVLILIKLAWITRDSKSLSTTLQYKDLLRTPRKASSNFFNLSRFPMVAADILSSENNAAIDLILPDGDI